MFAVDAYFWVNRYFAIYCTVLYRLLVFFTTTCNCLREITIALSYYMYSYIRFSFWIMTGEREIRIRPDQNDLRNVDRVKMTNKMSAQCKQIWPHIFLAQQYLVQYGFLTRRTPNISFGIYETFTSWTYIRTLSNVLVHSYHQNVSSIQTNMTAYHNDILAVILSRYGFLTCRSHNKSFGIYVTHLNFIECSCQTWSCYLLEVKRAKLYRSHWTFKDKKCCNKSFRI